MSEAIKHKCAGTVWRGWIGGGDSACGKGAAHEHDGKWYCKTHHPPTVKGKDIARRVKWDKEAAEREQAREAAAEQKRRSDCYDQLVDRVKELEEALRRLLNAELDTHLTVQGVRNLARAALSKSLPNTVAEVQ